MEFKRILIIQTAFIGDVILATPVIEQLKKNYPDAQIDFLLRKGNESLLMHDQRINHLLIWDKKKGKYKELFRLLKLVRANRYHLVVNLQRFASMGLLTFFSKGSIKVGFDKNPFSFGFDLAIRHDLDNGHHEVERNLSMIQTFVDDSFCRPSLQIPQDIFEQVKKYQSAAYLTLAPTSVWFTKQFPKEQWIRFLQTIRFEGKIYLLGAPSDKEACESLVSLSGNDQAINLCGELSLLASAALMKGAVMNYVNDSAPMHLASAMNAPVAAIYCSTIPAFGFGPLSEEAHIVEVSQNLACRPCGLHGKKKCPEGHFNCGQQIDIQQLIKIIPSTESPGSAG